MRSLPILKRLALASILYGALVAMAQTDLKKLIAYSSVSHMGYVMLGIAAAAPLVFWLARGPLGRLHRLSDKGLLDLSRMFNPIIRGWIDYYGSFYRSALYPLFDQLNRSLKRWAMRKYKRLRGRQRQAAYWLRSIRSQQPSLFSHWQLASHLVAGR